MSRGHLFASTALLVLIVGMGLLVRNASGAGLERGRCMIKPSPPPSSSPSSSPSSTPSRSPSSSPSSTPSRSPSSTPSQSPSTPFPSRSPSSTPSQSPSSSPSSTPSRSPSSTPSQSPSSSPSAEPTGLCIIDGLPVRCESVTESRVDTHTHSNEQDGGEKDYYVGDICTYRGEFVDYDDYEGEEGDNDVLAGDARHRGITVCCEVKDPFRDIQPTPNTQCAPCHECEDNQFVNDGCCAFYFWEKYNYHYGNGEGGNDRKLDGIFRGGCIDQNHGSKEQKCCKCRDEYVCTDEESCALACSH